MTSINQYLDTFTQNTIALCILTFFIGNIKIVNLVIKFLAFEINFYWMIYKDNGLIFNN
jgi:hypothetical protein